MGGPEWREQVTLVELACNRSQPGGRSLAVVGEVETGLGGVWLTHATLRRPNNTLWVLAAAQPSWSVPPDALPPGYVQQAGSHTIQPLFGFAVVRTGRAGAYEVWLGGEDNDTVSRVPELERGLRAAEAERGEGPAWRRLGTRPFLTAALLQSGSPLLCGNDSLSHGYAILLV